MGRSMLGMKVYDSAWFTRYNMDYAEGACWLKEHGITSVFTVNKYLPPPHSPTAVPLTPEQAARLERFDDLAFRNALQAEGLEYWATASMFYDTEVLDSRPESRPINRFGVPMPPQDWYRGCCPTDPFLVERKIASILDCVRAFSPDGIFLTFIRFPGFWEGVLPETTRDQIPLACFCPRCLKRFSSEMGVSLPKGDTKAIADWILSHERAKWADWKCRVIADVVRQVREAVQAVKPDTRIAFNTIPFGRSDYENAPMEVYGQGIEHLAPYVDLFEVMTYHQILKRPPSWIPTITAEVKERSGKPVICTVQVEPLYTEGYHAPAHRNPVLGPEEFEQSLDAAANSVADGAMVFAWTDFLNQTAAGEYAYVEALKRFRNKQ